MSLARAIRRISQLHGPVSVGQRETIGRRNTIPAPTKGWNTRDPLADMNAAYAVVLDNFFPDRGAVRLRRGFTEHATGVGTGYVETLIPHYSGSVAKFYAIGGGSLYDITMSGAVSTALASSLTSNVWSWAAAGGSTILANGADTPMRIEPAGTIATAHGWTGITTASNLNKPLAFKNPHVLHREGHV